MAESDHDEHLGPGARHDGGHDPGHRGPHAGRRGVFRDPALGFLLFFAGIALIVLVSMSESSRLEDVPWARAIVSTEGEPLTEDAIPLLAKRIPLKGNYPDTAEALEMLQRVKRKVEASAEPGGEPVTQAEQALAGFIDPDKTGLDHTEWLITADIPEDQLKSLIASGRLPAPNRREVLAGAYARLDRFKSMDIEFEVVGRLKPTVSGLYFSYLKPAEENFDARFERGGATRGWIEPSPGEAFRNALEGDSESFSESTILAGVPSRAIHSLGVIAGLMLVALGGAILQLKFLARLRQADPVVIGPALRALGDWPFLLASVHVVLYGMLFIAMMAGMRMPVANMMLMDIVRQEFAEGGGLAYVGEAYASGNIAWAAVATWINNFLLQTVAMTFLPTIVVPFLGMVFALIKTPLSFVMVGFAMAPTWVGMNSRFSYHSVTLTLELEAYVLAVFFVCLWPVLAYRVITGHGRREALWTYPSAIVLTGVMLAVGAAYEAVTLILIR